MTEDVEILSQEIGFISNAIESGVSKLVDGEAGKKYFDEELGNLIKATIIEAVQTFSETESKKEYYDKGIGEIIKNALGEVIKKISSIKIDLSPIMQISADITDQNERILNAILNVPKPETNDEKYQELLLKYQELFAEVMKKAFKETPIIKIEKKKFEFTVTKRDELHNKIQEVVAIEK